MVYWYDYYHATNLFLVDASVVDVTWEGARGVLVEHVALYTELGPLSSVSADTKEVANLSDRVT